MHLLQVLTNPLRVEEGGEGWISENHLRVSDPDSSEDSLKVELKRPAQHGSIQLNGAPIRPGQTFTLLDLKRLKVRSGTKPIQFLFALSYVTWFSRCCKYETYIASFYICKDT